MFRHADEEGTITAAEIHLNGLVVREDLLARESDKPLIGHQLVGERVRFVLGLLRH